MALKGTTRRIIEVNGTNSCYFEKAVLYVRPECAPIEESSLEREAREYTAKLAEYAADEKGAVLRRILINALVKLGVILISLAVIGFVGVQLFY